jgi:NAD(P)-dependent dehydrogenase (short-subunit alcohol dehydrogenase family)
MVGVGATPAAQPNHRSSIIGTEQKVAVVTGASQGIGAGLVKAFRGRNRSIKPASDEDILTVAGDIADSYTEAEFAAVVSTNLAGFFHVTQRAIEAMERQGSGHIVNITTSLVNHANSAVPSVLASLTKGGLDAATRSLAIEFA